MAKIIAIANQKGGVGKTTTVVNIAAGLAELGKKVLCIDLDPQATLAPQGNLSDYLGYDFTGKRTIVDVLKETAKLSECILTAKSEPIDYVPADISLAAADMFLAQTVCRKQILDKAISCDSISEDYDYLLIDCLPSLGILVMNALAAADEVIIPVQVPAHRASAVRARFCVQGTAGGSDSPRKPPCNQGHSRKTRRSQAHYPSLHSLHAAGFRAYGNARQRQTYAGDSLPVFGAPEQQSGGNRGVSQS